MKVGAKGVVRCKVLKVNGEVKVDTGDFNNLLLNNFFDRALKGHYLNAKVTVGTSSIPPSPEQNSMPSMLTPLKTATSSADSSMEYDVGTGIAKCYKEWEFKHEIGEVDGNISDLGFSISSASSQNSLDSRVLIVDSLGNPTSITVLASEQLVISYRLELIMPINPSGEDFTFEISGVTYNANCRPAKSFKDLVAQDLYKGDINLDTAGWFGISTNNTVNSLFSNPSGISTKNLDNVQIEYPSEKPYTIRKTGTIPINYGNYSDGIGAFTLAVKNSGYHFAYYVTPKIPKTSSEILTLAFEMSFQRME